MLRKSSNMTRCFNGAESGGQIKELMQYDDCRPLIKLIRDQNIRRDLYDNAVAQAKRQRWFAFQQRRAENRLWSLCAQIDDILIVLDQRAHMISLHLYYHDWAEIVDDIFGAVRALRFYRRGLPLLELDAILSYLLNIRLESFEKRLFELWDKDGYLSYQSTDWASDMMKLLDICDQPFVFHKLSRQDYEELASEFYALIGRDQPQRPASSCAICLEDIDAKMRSATFCHSERCGRVYHTQCIGAWVQTRTSKALIPKCPVCNGIWVTRQRSSFF